MTYKQIEASREVRLWIGQIIVPAATLVGTYLMTSPEARHRLKQKMNDIGSTIKNKFQKEES
jgi:hypothetical protein